jgi:hypothetical protein
VAGINLERNDASLGLMFDPKSERKKPPSADPRRKLRLQRLVHNRTAIVDVVKRGAYMMASEVMYSNSDAESPKTDPPTIFHVGAAMCCSAN